MSGVGLLGATVTPAAADVLTIGIVDWVECGYDADTLTHTLIFGGDAYAAQCQSNSGPTPEAPFALFFLTNFGEVDFQDAEMRLLGPDGSSLGFFLFAPNPVFLIGGATNPTPGGALRAELYLEIPGGAYANLRLPTLDRPDRPDPGLAVFGVIEAERLAVVPEPGTLLLLAAGSALLAHRRRHRRV